MRESALQPFCSSRYFYVITFKTGRHRERCMRFRVFENFRADKFLTSYETDASKNACLSPHNVSVNVVLPKFNKQFNKNTFRVSRNVTRRQRHGADNKHISKTLSSERARVNAISTTLIFQNALFEILSPSEILLFVY